MIILPLTKHPQTCFPSSHLLLTHTIPAIIPLLECSKLGEGVEEVTVPQEYFPSSIKSQTPIVWWYLHYRCEASLDSTYNTSSHFFSKNQEYVLGTVQSTEDQSQLNVQFVYGCARRQGLIRGWSLIIHLFC